VPPHRAHHTCSDVWRTCVRLNIALPPLRAPVRRTATMRSDLRGTSASTELQILWSIAATIRGSTCCKSAHSGQRVSNGDSDACRAWSSPHTTLCAGTILKSSTSTLRAQRGVSCRSAAKFRRAEGHTRRRNAENTPILDHEGDQKLMRWTKKCPIARQRSGGSWRVGVHGTLQTSPVQHFICNRCARAAAQRDIQSSFAAEPILTKSYCNMDRVERCSAAEGTPPRSIRRDMAGE